MSGTRLSAASAGIARSAVQAGVTIRRTRWPDLTELARLEVELFGAEAWSEVSWWAELAARPRRAYLTALVGDRVVGYAGIDRGGVVADVMTIALAPAARGSGLGRRLLRDLLALRAGAEAVMLEVRADNKPALSLYASEGFELVSTRRRYYGDVDALVLRRLSTVRDIRGPAAPTGAAAGLSELGSRPDSDPGRTATPTLSDKVPTPSDKENA